MDPYRDLDSPTREKRIAKDETKAKLFAEKMKTSKLNKTLVETKERARENFLIQVHVQKITNSKYGRFIKLVGECVKPISVRTSWITIDQGQAFITLPEDNLKIINDFITLIRENLTYDDIKILTH